MMASASNWVFLGSLAALAACGGRTSTLLEDNDPSLGSSVPSSSAGSAGSAAGGSTSSSPAGAGTPGSSPGTTPGSGGSISTPAGGAPSFAGSTATAGAPAVGGSPAIAPACSNFCDKVQHTPCAAELGLAADCADQCTGALGTDACAPQAKALLDCYLPIFTVSAGNCSNIGERAVRRCSSQAQAFQSCADANSPTPPPPPSPSCSGTGSGTATTCNLSSNCNDGSSYVVNCKQASPSETVCNCYSAGGVSANVTLTESVANACTDASQICYGSTLPK